jgi:predicted transcriptional regulator
MSMVDLRTWLGERKDGRNIRRLAMRAGVSRNVIYRVRDGHVPRHSTARVISEATDGAVSVDEILQREPKHEAA